MHKRGLVDEKSMSEFDPRCLTTVDEMWPRTSRSCAEREVVSQAEFARGLNVTTNYSRPLERGSRRPRRAMLKLLSLVKSKGLEILM